ncbi:hypothetical protein B0I35DRAFT_401084 [Stachybotrys elegans]|uniref:Fungal STAND N-terminal Goodbye domain-containing protein n=1 Tax=Stachybotrys elegans TaxID=80388 RepID=A0A8K0WJQ7_9HYPO|nr:hypothetical protein B0I35DRAFT_401084 [Stachybotrys elegans]
MANAKLGPENAALPLRLEGDHREMGDIWVAALSRYKGIMGFELELKYTSMQDVIDAGAKEMEGFHKWRHNRGKIDRLRTLFTENLDFLEQGSQQLLTAATASFPPAAAIGTALTYLLSACRKQSADYDVVETFFEDMQSFLKRADILGSRVPQNRGWQNCLMDVFTSLLEMSGIATKFVELGRFKKWIMQIITGDDSELSDARDKLAKSLDRLQDATRLAILGNTEDIETTNRKLATMNRELADNQKRHNEKLSEHTRILLEMMTSNEAISEGVSRLLRAMEERKREKREAKDNTLEAAGKEKQIPTSANLIGNALPYVEDAITEYHIAKDSLVEGTCRWIFSEPVWEEWMRGKERSKPPLIITGPPGIGKSHLAVVIYDELVHLAREDKENHAVATHFYFREHRPSLSVFRNAVYTIIKQISQQSAYICDILCDQFNSDTNNINVASWQELVSKLLASAFAEQSKTRLFVVLDGVDELSPQETQETNMFLQEVRSRQLNISVIITGRYESQIRSDGNSQFLQLVSKDKQLSSLKMLTWNRLNSLRAPRRFSRFAKQRIADKIIEISPNLLHAEHMLSRFDEIGRESAVLDELKRDDFCRRKLKEEDDVQKDELLPVSLDQLYERMLAECKRRTPTDRHGIVTALFYWIAFSFRPLLLDEVLSLLRYLSGDSSLEPEDLPQPFSKFLIIGDPVAGAEDSELSDTDADSALDRSIKDGDLRVEFRERAMRAFFRGAENSPSNFVTPRHQAHRNIFVTCARILRNASVQGVDGSGSDRTLRNYAATYALKHMLEIYPGGGREGMEVMAELGWMLSNRYDFATDLESFKVNLSDLFSWRLLQHWGVREEEETGVQMKASSSLNITSWWKCVKGAPRSRLLFDLAKAYLQRLYSSCDRISALVSYRGAIFFFGMSHYGQILAQRAKAEFDISIGKDLHNGRRAIRRSEAALGICLVLDGIDMKATAYWAIGEVLYHYGHYGPAKKKCKDSLDLIMEPLHRFRALELLARIYLADGRFRTALKKVTDSLKIMASQKAEISPSAQRATHVTKARILKAMADTAAAAKAYSRARKADPLAVTPGEILDEEVGLFFNHDETLGAAIDIVKSFAPLDRLTWMTWQWWSQGHERHTTLQLAAARGGRASEDFLEGAYIEALRYLDDVNAGAPLRYYLARFYLQIRQDNEAAQAVLDDLLDEGRSTNGRNTYKFTEEDPSRTLHRAILLQTDVLFRRFCVSTDPAIKEALVKDVQALPRRPLALEVSLFSSTALLHHRIIVARMVRKTGPAAEFQRLLNNIFTDARDSLMDAVTWNDDVSLAVLGTALTLLGEAAPAMKSELLKAARIMVSARLEVDQDSTKRTGAKETNYNHSGHEGKDDEDDEDDRENYNTSGREDKDDENDEDDEDGSDVEDDDNLDEFLDDNGDDVEDDEGDAEAKRYQYYGSGIRGIRCEGDCNPRTIFANWAESGVGYQCTTCSNTLLCQACHSALQENDQGGRVLCRHFCGSQHAFLRAPIEGWGGVRAGKLIMQGEKPVHFQDEYLRVEIPGLIKRAWEEFWKGG